MVRPSLVAFALAFPVALTPRSVGSSAEPTLLAPGGDIPTTVTPWHDPLRGTARAPARRSASTLVTLTPQTDDFAANVATLNPAGAYDNVYTVHFFVTVTINGSSQQYGGATLVIGIETNDGGGWVERAAPSYGCSYLSGPPPWASRTCSWSHEQASISVAGLGLNDQIRLVTKSFTTSNGAGGSFGYRGGDGAGPNPEPYNGVTYTTDIIPISWAQSDDFASGNGIASVGGTAGVNLDPGDAIDNVYTVHHYVSVTINAHPSTYGTASLTVAFETNDGTGSGWVERGTAGYNCSYLSGPPPYPQRTCPAWTHEQVPMTVTGLGINDSIRLKAKAFTTSNGAGGSFVIRGGDGGGLNPETYNGVTYSTKVFRGVAVRPELPERQGFASATGSQRFFVKNRGETDANLSLGFSCTVLSSCSVTPASFSLVPPGESRAVTLTYTVGAAGTTGTGMVKVFDNFDSNTLRDSASVAVKAVAAPAPLVSVVDMNPGTAIERDQCVTIAAGSAGAFECGDLRIVHALPAIRTLNKARVPTLLYNSALAEPLPVVAASVTRATGTGVPDSVEAILFVGGQPKAQGRWVGSDWAPGATRRIALAAALIDTTSLVDTSKVIDYTLEVATIYLGSPGSRNATTVGGKVIVVNRRRSSFGAGWWLAGLERLELLTDGNRLWVGGDGSARLYTSVGTDIWAAANLDRPDTLKRMGTSYLRRLPSGVKVWFNAAGQHDSTVNRLGHRTTFAYTSDRLSMITLPSQGGGQTYMFGYDGNNKLSSVTSPGAPVRVTTVRVSTQRVDSIRDPDNTTIRFTYESPSSRRITTRTDRRGTVTSYSYDVAQKLWRAHIALPGDSIRVGFRAVDLQGLVTATPKTAADTANVFTSFFGARQFTHGVDSIGQETKFWLARSGAPRRIVNALGQQTLVKREDGEWPTLATELIAANGFVTRASYDGRGNIARSTAVNPLGDPSPGPEDDAMTRYHWNSTWDFVDSVVTPTGVTTTMAYDAMNGNRLWQQVGSDAARRVTFAYYASGPEAGLLRAAQLPDVPGGGTARDSVVYSTGLVNLAATRTPRGFWTSYYKDGLGRDTLIVTPIDSTDVLRGGEADSTIRLRQRTVYTVMDRDSISESIAPNRAQTLRVDKRHDAEGNLTSVARVSAPDATGIGTIVSRFGLDRANRVVADTAPDGYVEQRTYDPAGNVRTITTRRGHVITSTYDDLNRLKTRTVPSVTYQDTLAGIAARDGEPYPRMPNSGSDYLIGAETDTLVYDVMSRIQTANNGDARVTRTYYPNGLLETERQDVRDATGSIFSHSYLLRYTYDRDGRRRSVKLPSQLVPAGTRDSVSVTYDPLTGELKTVTDPLGNVFTYSYTLRGEPSSLAYPGLYTQRWSYLADGSLQTDSILNSGGTSGLRWPNTVLRATRLRYDGRAKVLRSEDAMGFRDTIRTSFSGLGHVATSYMSQNGELVGFPQILHRYSTGEQQEYDALGNMDTVTTADTSKYNGTIVRASRRGRSLAYSPGVGRLLSEASTHGPKAYLYDADGNLALSMRDYTPVSPSVEDRFTYYAADGRVRAADFRTISNALAEEAPRDWVFEEYRYDALGRRVWVRTYRECAHYNPLSTPEALECQISSLRRTIWDGQQELMEIQVPGDAAQPPAVLENDDYLARLPRVNTMDPNPFYGRVLYVHGIGLDQPIAITRYRYVDFFWNRPYTDFPPSTMSLFWNARGQMGIAACATGNRPCQHNGYDMGLDWASSWFAYDRPKFTKRVFQGTLIHDKQDAVQTVFRRNRYYDPASGRFTQEDPIGLAGGLNLYGFAAGDPVNFADPFGLQGCDKGATGECKNSIDWAAAAKQWLSDRLDDVVQMVGGVIDALTPAGDIDRAVTGKDFLSGAALSGGQRARAGLMAAASLFPGEQLGAGLAKGIAKTIDRAQGAEVAFSRVGRNVRAVWEVPGRTGAGYARWNRVLNGEGSTIRLFKDVFGQGGEFIRRDWYVGGPR